MEPLKDYLNNMLVVESNRPKKDLENAHSDRLAQILNYKDLCGNSWVLQNFVNEFFFMNDIAIVSPQITREDEGIDILIQDSFYAIIFENKVNHARDRHHQIARYIDTLVNRGRNLKEIYVVYLQQNRLDKPQKQTFGQYLTNDDVMDNFYLIPCRPELLEWLEMIQKANVITDGKVSKAIKEEIKWLEKDKK